ncbi:metallophosphoesterase [Serratia sp. Se-RSBMAAmG]|uniref:metallophosphoesterase n=1 Tax=Serratia sp. Se-RSBMAAmG TaxID=3043305 RepID=UPI0024AEC3C6|nr:metallophosphoesterase [Serratia sp. Se-RSBMAAmG]MDI6977151.1 metallophosphoesterase [Serratia sp. Se-RSBMAAmG]
MFFVYTGILFSYLLITIILPLPAPVFLKVCLALLLFAVTQLHYVSRKISGMMVANYPKPLLYAWEYLFAFAVILFLTSLPVNLIKAFTWLLSLNTTFHAVNSESAQYGLIGISSLLSLYSFYQGNKVPSVKRKVITLNNWPDALNGFTIAQLSDLHVSNLLTQKWLSSVVNQTNALNPDLIVITGDFTDGHPSNRLKLFMRVMVYMAA